MLGYLPDRFVCLRLLTSDSPDSRFLLPALSCHTVSSFAFSAMSAFLVTDLATDGRNLGRAVCLRAAFSSRLPPAFCSKQEGFVDILKATRLLSLTSISARSALPASSAYLCYVSFVPPQLIAHR